jgi:hypothetical protein
MHVKGVRQARTMDTDRQAVNKARVPDVMALLLIRALTIAVGHVWFTPAVIVS